MSPVAANMSGQFGDTTFTKVFVGGLAWETQREAMRKYFEQFGDILEAVVITDKNTGRSKGYGFVTFSEPEAATRACVDPSPVIDGRRANCNLASLGVQKSTPTTPQGANRSFRVIKSFHSAATFPSQAVSATAAAHYHAIPNYNVYGYSPYSQDYSYPTSFYNVYGGAATQYPMYGGAAGTYYPYFQFTQGAAYGQQGHGQGYGLQYPQMFHYSSTHAVTGGFPPQFNGPVSFAATPQAQPVSFAIKQA